MRLTRTIALAFTLFFLLLGGLAMAEAPIPAPPSVAARAYLLMDFDSGRVLAEGNADERMEPASLTKIMTAYTVFRELREGHIGLKDMVTVSEHAWKMGGSKMFIEVGKQVSVEDLLKGLIIQSGNDAGVALAEHVAGSEAVFAELMNNHAKRLGMDHSHFADSSGMPDPNHYTTARDIAKVAQATIREFPEYYKWYAEHEFTFNGITQHNRNRLLWRDKSVDGVKTGHTESAGYCLVSSALRDGMRLIAVVMGTKGDEVRAKESQALLNYGFRFFETHKLYAAGTELTRVRIWKGAADEVALGLGEDLYVTIPRNRYDDLNANMSIEPQIFAPVTQGRTYGRVNIALDGDVIAQAPLLARNDVAEGGLWDIAVDSVLLWFE